MLHKPLIRPLYERSDTTSCPAGKESPSMIDDASSSKLHDHLRLATEPPDPDLLRRYWHESTGSPKGTLLTEAEKRWVTTNIELNPAWQDAWSKVHNVTDLGKSTPAADRPPFSHKKRLVFKTLGSAALLYGLLWVGGRALLPETHALASTEAFENHLDRQTRSTSTEAQTRFAAAARSLLTADESTLGLFPRYDQERAQEAIENLNQAFAISSDPFERAEIAFFLGKAHLMRSNIDSARFWLKRVEVQQVTDYRSEAADLLEQIESAAS